MTPSIFFKRLYSPSNLPLFVAFLLLLGTLFIKPVAMKKPVFTLQVGFDISQSMLVSDVSLNGQSLSRLEYAKARATTLLQKLPCGSKVGWSVFTGRRTLTLIMPLEVCDHYAGLIASLAEVNGSMRWKNGSSIGKGIHQIMRAADEFPEQTTIIFITDGQEAPPLELGQKGVPRTDKFDVQGLLVGVGGDIAVPIPKYDASGDQVGYWSADEVVQRIPANYAAGEELSKRDDERLRQLARLTALEYVVLNSDREFAKSVTNSRFAERRDTPTDIRWIPALLALLLILWRFLPSYNDLKPMLWRKISFRQ